MSNFRHNIEPSKIQDKVTLDDVARAAGVGKTAVSYALNGKGNLSDKTRENVLQAARELGYESNYFAQNLKTTFRDVVALCAGIDLGVGTVKIWEIQHRLDYAGHSVEIYNAPIFVSDESQKQLEMLQLVRRLKPRAIICEIASLRAGLNAGGYEEMRRYMETGGTLICYNCGDAPAIECDTVLYDEPHSAYLMGRHLLDFGHRKIGICIHNNDKPETHPHLRGFKRALEEGGVTPDERWIWAECCQEDGGARLAQKVLAMPRRDWPTAIGIINDVAAGAFINALTRAGFQIPRDLSVIGHDDVPAAKHCIVPLSTISHPSSDMAEALVEMVLSRFENRYEGAPRTVTVRGQLISRDSVTPLCSSIKTTKPKSKLRK